MQTAYDLIWLSAERTPDHLALVDDLTERALSYRALIEEIDAVAAGLAERGVTAGQRVATALPGLFDHGVVTLALQRLGAVPALMNFRLDAADIAGLIRQGGIGGAVIPSDPDLAAAMAGELPDGAPLLAVGGAVGPASDYAACRGDPAQLLPLPRPGREDEAFIFYTSGTTGLPKGVVLAQRTTEHRILWLSTQAGLRHGNHNRALGFMPLSHAIGYYGVFLATLGLGGTYYVMSAFQPQKAVEMAERYAITYMFAIPTLYHAMTMAPGYAPERLASLEVVLYGGAAIEPELVRHMDDNWGGTVRHIYGTTETMCSLYNPDPVEAPAKLRPGFYSRTRAIQLGGGPDDLVAAGDEGELIIDATADTIFSGYLNRPEASAKKMKDGWYWSGDIVVAEPDGDLTLCGRVDDMIRSGGESLHPEEVEAVLDLHPGVAESSVIGLDDPHWGQIVVACVVRSDDEVDVAALDAHCRASSLAGYKRPKAYLTVSSLPRNAAGKVLRRLLRDTAADARKGSDEAVFEAVVS
jgi:acyl-CoA synthetase (AMP-forming)/AMP-acid ligase II